MRHWNLSRAPISRSGTRICAEERRVRSKSADGSALNTPRCALMVLSLLVAACLVGGCGAAAPGAGHNKAGAAVDSPRVLRLEDPDPGDPEMVYLAQQIQRRSHGSLRVQ